ncbi:MAG: transposase [Candidatus Acidiferrales bacterium]
MPKGLKRYYGRGHLVFLTFSCYRRLPLLSTIRARNHFVHVLDKIRERYKFLLVGYVVIPNHVHLLISEPAKGTPSVVLKVLKQRVSRDLRRSRRREIPTRKPDVWGTRSATVWFGVTAVAQNGGILYDTGGIGSREHFDRARERARRPSQSGDGRR